MCTRICVYLKFNNEVKKNKYSNNLLLEVNKRKYQILLQKDSKHIHTISTHTFVCVYENIDK